MGRHATIAWRLWGWNSASRRICELNYILSTNSSIRSTFAPCMPLCAHGRNLLCCAVDVGVWVVMASEVGLVASSERLWYAWGSGECAVRRSTLASPLLTMLCPGGSGALCLGHKDDTSRPAAMHVDVVRTVQRAAAPLWAHCRWHLSCAWLPQNIATAVPGGCHTLGA